MMNTHLVVGLKIKNLLLKIGLVTITFLLIQGCRDDYSITGVNSPDPGILEIYMVSDDADNFIVIAGDTITVGDGVNDSLALRIGQARAFRDSSFAVLFKGLSEYEEIDYTYNAIKQQDGKFEEFLIMRSYLPPAVYDSFKVVITANLLQLGYYYILIDMPEGEDPLMKFDDNFEIKENTITRITLQLKPFQSLIRVKDNFVFYRDIQVVNIAHR